jgi:hypothetical protein
MPPSYNPALLSNHQLTMDCVDFKDRLDILYAMWSDTFRAWRDSIQRTDTQEVIDAYEKAHKSVKRRTAWIYGKLHKARKEKMTRHFNSMGELVQDLNTLKEELQDAQKLRTTQGENGTGP